MLMRMWSNRNSHSLLMGTSDGTDTLDDSLAVSYKAKHTLSMWSSSRASWCLSKELKTYVHTKICTWIFIAALFIIAKKTIHGQSFAGAPLYYLERAPLLQDSLLPSLRYDFVKARHCIAIHQDIIIMRIQICSVFGVYTPHPWVM